MTPLALGWLHIAILLGAIQGILLAAVLAAQRRNRTANRLLAVAMLAFSIFMFSGVYYAVGWARVFPHFIGAAYPMPLLFGPLVYLYAVTASDRTRRLRRRDGLHFLPFAAVVIAGLPIYLLGGAAKIAFYQGLQHGLRPLLIRVADPLKFVSGISYATATILFLRRHGARIRDSYSSLERVNLQWLIRLALGSAAIWALATALSVTAWAHIPFLREGDDAVELAIAILVYAIGYMGLSQPEIFNYATLDYRPLQREKAPPQEIAGPTAAPLLAPPAPPAASAAQPAEAAGPRYERSGLSDREAAALKQALLAAMDTDRPYQDCDLTLADLAERLDTTPHKLSEVLNSQLAQSFYDFVNAYRVQDVQRRIVEERSKNLTILALAIDAGFASKSTFNHVFKKYTGLTPSDYRRSIGR